MSDTKNGAVRPTVYARDLHLAENLSPEQEKMREALIALARASDPHSSGYDHTETVETVEYLHSYVVRATQGFAALLNAETIADPTTMLHQPEVEPATPATQPRHPNGSLRGVSTPVHEPTDDLPEVRAYAKYEWDCECGEVGEEDHDPQGETVECVSCDAKSHVRESL